MWAWAKYRHCLAAFDTCEGKKLTELSQMQEMEHLEERQRKILCLSSLLLHLDGLAGYPAQWIGCLPEHEKAWMCSVRRGIDWKCTKTLCLLFRRHNVLGWIQAVGEGHPASQLPLLLRNKWYPVRQFGGMLLALDMTHAKMPFVK